MTGLNAFLRYNELLGELVSRDIKVKYRRSVLGLLWTVLNPLLMMVVMTIVFSNIFRQDIENFPVYLLCGQTIFSFFSESTTMAMGSIVSNSALIKKVYIPKYFFPLSKVLSSMVNLLASFIALIIVMIATASSITWRAIFALLPIIFVFLFSYGMGLLLSTIATEFRDMMHLYSVITTAWLYITPIFYPMSMLPDWIKPVVENNPITVFLMMFRGALMDDSAPTGELLIKALLWCVGALVIGTIAFKKKQDKFILRV